jgi:hypothetical protein
MPLTWVRSTLACLMMAAPKSEILMSDGPAQQDVGRLDVAVGDAEAVGIIERPRAFENQLDDAVDRQQAAGMGMGFQRAAGDILHDDIAEILGDHGIVDLDDVRVVELADQRGLVEEQVAVQLALFRVAQDARAGNLDRHVALGKRVAAEVDGAGRTFPERLDQFVFAELLLHRSEPAARPPDGGPDLFRGGAADVVAAGQRTCHGQHRKNVIFHLRAEGSAVRRASVAAGRRPWLRRP